MVEILLNGCYGSFCFNKQVFDSIINTNIANENDYVSPYDDDHRTDQRLIAIFKEKGSEYLSGNFCKLYLKEIPELYYKHSAYEIIEYDGKERLYLNTNLLKYKLILQELKDQNIDLYNNIVKKVEITIKNI